MRVPAHIEDRRTARHAVAGSRNRRAARSRQGKIGSDLVFASPDDPNRPRNIWQAWAVAAATKMLRAGVVAEADGPTAVGPRGARPRRECRIYGATYAGRPGMMPADIIATLDPIATALTDAWFRVSESADGVRNRVAFQIHERHGDLTGAGPFMFSNNPDIKTRPSGSDGLAELEQHLL